MVHAPQKLLSQVRTVASSHPDDETQRVLRAASTWAEVAAVLAVGENAEVAVIRGLMHDWRVELVSRVVRKVEQPDEMPEGISDEAA